MENSKLVILIFFVSITAFSFGQENDIPTEAINIISLQGVWFEIGEENATFSIKDDTLLFLENQTTFVTIKVEKDSLYYFSKNEVRADKIEKLKSDTLILNWNEIITTYIKREK